MSNVVVSSNTFPFSAITPKLKTVKMPFITNDFNHLLVDDVEYEKNPEKYKHFVVARRLLVSSKEPFSDEYLRERFKKYGHIVSSKVLQSKREGFVTFECDRHACLAYDREKDKCADKVVRVDSTWHQPDGSIQRYSEWIDEEDEFFMETDKSVDEPIDSEASSPLLQLDNDSLFAVFDRCCNLSLAKLSMTCSRLERLLKGGDYHFPNQRTFDYEPSMKWSLVDAEKVFRLMGRYFEKLDVWFNEWVSEETIFAYVRFITTYCRGGKVKDVSFEMFHWKNEIWPQLGPVLRNLSKLRLCIHDYSDEDVTVDFTELCPSLDTLVLWDTFIVEKSLTKTLPTLKTFIWPFSWDELVTGLESFEFFYANRQLKDFECHEFNFENMPLTLLLLPNIETLTLCVPDSPSTADILNLEKFRNLRSLTIDLTENNPSTQAERQRIVNSCGRLKNLVELKLCFTKARTDEPAMRLSTTLAHLERLDLLGVRLDEQIVAEFVREASNIKTMHFHKCDVYATESLLARLEACMEAKSSRRQYRFGCSLFIGDESRNSFVAINRKNRQVKSIPWTCKQHNT